MTFLIQQTLLYAVPLMIVALAGVFAERSGIINLALEGIMIFGAFIGVLFVRLVQMWGWFDAAKAAGVDDRLGSIAVGKDADIVVFNGHPFHYLTKTSAVFINGKRED